MKKSKKIFLILSVIFFLIIILISIDISRKTTFPGSKNHWEETVAPSDSTNNDEGNEKALE